MIIEGAVNTQKHPQLPRFTGDEHYYCLVCLVAPSLLPYPLCGYGPFLSDLHGVQFDSPSWEQLWCLAKNITTSTSKPSQHVPPNMTFHAKKESLNLDVQLCLFSTTSSSLPLVGTMGDSRKIVFGIQALHFRHPLFEAE